MPERPLLALDSPVQDRRLKKTRFTPPIPKLPNRERQFKRLGPRFNRLSQVIKTPDNILSLRSDPTSLVPDRALVFEVAGSLRNFASQAAKAGFNFLGEISDEFDQDEDFYFVEYDNKIQSTLYLVMPDLRAMQELLSLWQRYVNGEEFERGKGQWKTLFSHLRSIRSWGPKDRITDNFKERLLHWIDSNTDAPFRFEIDLWFSKSESKREIARNSIVDILDDLNGELLHESVISAIGYHGLLCLFRRKSSEYLDKIELSPISLLDAIMYLNPRAMSVYKNVQAMEELITKKGKSTRPPVAAILDGFPLSNHVALEGRIRIDDYLDIESVCPAAKRFHGTAMASLILHGDLNNDQEQPLDNELLVLPILRPDPDNPDYETTLSDKLIIDTVYRAIVRIKEGEKDSDPTGENVIIINHSLADNNSPYLRRISPWARLLDYLSFKYKILFIVSAGNYDHSLPIQECKTTIAFSEIEIEDRTDLYFKSLASDMRNRQVYSPAEGLNSITVGAWHADSCRNGDPPGNLIDILPDENGPSVITAIGLGHKRSVKPDLFYDGGRLLVNVFPNGEYCVLRPLNQPTRFSGQKVASPSSRGLTNRTTNICGTSNAAALITRQAIKINTMLDELTDFYLDFFIPNSHRAVLIKALLAHGCDWGTIGERLERIIEPIGSKQWQPRRTNIARLIGLGKPNIERVIECTAQRATMLGWGTLEVDGAHNFSIPLPESLSERRDLRRMTVSLAWLSPVNVLHQQYRQAVLELKLNSNECGTERKNVLQVPSATIGRGTILHHIYEGKKNVLFDEEMILRVECREQAGSLDDQIPYGLAVSFEVGQGSEIDVYNQIRTKLAQRQPIVV